MDADEDLTQLLHLRLDTSVSPHLEPSCTTSLSFGGTGAPSSLAFGFVAAIICNYATKLKYIFVSRFAIEFRSIANEGTQRYDDSLDIFATHGIGGFTGAVLTGSFPARSTRPRRAHLPACRALCRFSRRWIRRYGHRRRCVLFLSPVPLTDASVPGWINHHYIQRSFSLAPSVLHSANAFSQWGTSSLVQWLRWHTR